MNISDFGLQMIEAFEGYFARPYRCPAGVLTQGYGHTAAAGGRKIGGAWTRTEAREVLRDDLSRMFEPGVRKLIKRQPTQGQWDALVSFAFNCGLGNLARSSILKHFNRGDDEQAAAAFALYVLAAGKRLPGLVRRRGSEALAYQGVQDLNFDGRRQSDEPIYGAMPQKVERAREKIAPSGTIQGAGAATAGGAVIVAEKAKEILTEADQSWSSGTWLGIALALVILGGAGYALYCRWNDMGRPLPWKGGDT